MNRRERKRKRELCMTSTRCSGSQKIMRTKTASSIEETHATKTSSEKQQEVEEARLT